MNVNLRPKTCDPGRVESFLSGDLAGGEEREFLRHLEACDVCRRSLAEKAAEPAAWLEAEKLLRPCQFDSPCADEDSESATGKRRARQPLQIQAVIDALGPTDDPQMLGRLGGYEVSGVVGAGGMGVVLKAIDKSLDRTVAIKVLAPHLATSGAARKRFAREARAAAAVLHPNVIAIHGVSNDESLPYLVMPYVRGTSLEKRLDEQGPLALHEILRIGSQIAAGLAAAHAQGLVHRDIKPGNILLEEGIERVTITDFGLARAVDDAAITHTSVIAGTPQYMSPEQARGEAVDQRSDLFSLGSVLYAMCTGRPPFRAETSHGVLRRITDDEPKSIREINPDVPEWLCALVARLMSKRAADRFGSAGEVGQLLEQCLAHAQQPGSVPLPAGLPKAAPARASRRSNLTVIGVLAMIAAAVVGLLGIILLSAEPPDIAGQWSGDEWGQVVLKKTSDTEYSGTYNDTFSKQPGEIRLQWSRLERRYYGTWREGEDRFGELSARLVGEEIRGAWTADKSSKRQPGAPRLADLTWSRVHDQAVPPVAAGKPAFSSARESVLPYGAPCCQQYFQFRSGKVLIVGHGPATSKEEFAQDRKKVEEAGGADFFLGSNAGIQIVGEGCIFTQDFENLHWDTFTAEQAAKAMQRVNFSYGVMEPAVKDLPVTYLFKTSRGEAGVLQILGIVEDERGFRGSGPIGRGLKFRYKLVEQAAHPGQAGDVFRPAQPLAVAEPPTPPRSVAAGKQPTESQSRAIIALPMRLRYFTTGHHITIACSADGKLIAVANGNPTRILLVGGTSRVKGDWKPTADILDGETGKTIVSLKLSTEEENAVLAATERVSDYEVTALAISLAGNVVAVGTSIGQVKLFNPRTGELIRSLDDKEPRIADKDTPENWQPLQRALGSVANLAFSPDGSLLAVCGSTFREFSDRFDGVKRSTLATTGPGRLKVFAVQSGTLKHDLAGHSHAFHIAFSADGSLLASAGNWSSERENGTGAIIWDPQTGKKLRAIVAQANAGAHAVVFSPTKKLVAIASRQYDKENDTYSTTVSLTYALSGITEWQRSFPGGANPKAFSPDGKSVLVLGRQSIQLLDVETGATQREIKATDLSKDGSWVDFAIAPQVGRLVIGAVDELEGSVELWDLSDPGAAAKPAQ